MKYRLKIADVIEFPVTLKVRNGAAVEDHKFHISAKRIDSDQAAELFKPGSEQGEQSLGEFLTSHLKGWRGQKLVEDEAGQPAEFSHDALAALLQLPGAGAVIYGEYLKEIAASSGVEGRRKN